VALLSDNFVGSKLGTDIGLGHFAHKTGYNVCFSDGSGVYFDDPRESIAREKIPYDEDEDDAYNFGVLTPSGDSPAGSPPDMRIYEVWHDLGLLPAVD